MAAHERRTSYLMTCVIGFVAVSCLCAFVAEAKLDINDDGDIKFEPIPGLGEFVSDADYYKEDGQRLGMLGDMARGWVDFIQPQGFPIDYINHIILITTNDTIPIDVVDEVFLGLKEFVGIIICFLIGFFFFLLLPVIGLMFCCCRCCNNCGGKRVQEETKSMGCIRVTLTFILLCVTGIICAGMAFTNETNEFMGHAVDTTFTVVEQQVLEDSSSFLKGADGQLNFILVNQFEVVDGEIQDDLENIGDLIGGAFQDYLREDADVQETFDAFDQLISDLNKTTDTLHSITNSSLELDSQGTMLQTTLDDIATQLEDIHTRCSCVPDYDFQVTNFTQLPDVTEEMARSQNSQRNISEEYDKVVAVFDGIPGVIDTQSADVTEEIKIVLADTKEALKESSVEVSKMLEDFDEMIADAKVAINDAKEGQQEYEFYRTTDVTDWQSGMTAVWHHKQLFHKYRRYSVIGLCCMVLLIVMFNIIGLTMGSCAYKNVAPVDRSRMSNAGGNVLVAGVVFTFLFTPLLIFLCMGFFLPLAINTLTCEPLADLSLIRETIDRNDSIPDCEGYCAGKFILGNGSIPLTFSGILDACERNESLYRSLMLDTIFDTQFIDDELARMRDKAMELVDIIELDDFNLDLVPDDFRQDLKQAIDVIGLEGIAVEDFDKVLVPPAVPTNLEDYAILLEQKAENETSPDKEDLIAVADTLRRLYTDTVTPMEELMKTTLEAAQYTQELAATLDRDVNDTADAAFNSERLIDEPETEWALKNDTTDYIDLVIGYAEQYTDWATIAFEEDFAKCAPVRTIYDTTINTLCYYDLDALNAFWFTLGWCVFFFIPSIIFSMKLAKYYRIMDDMYEPKPKKQKKKKKKSNRDEEMAMDEMDDMPSTGHDNIRLVSDRGPPPMMAQQNPQYIPDEPIMAYQYNDLGRPMAPPPAYHPDISQWPTRGVGPSQSSMLLPPYGYYPSLNDARQGSAASYDAPWPSHWGRQQAFEYDDDNHYDYPYPEAYNPAFVGGHSSSEDFGGPSHEYPSHPPQGGPSRGYPQGGYPQGAYPQGAYPMGGPSYPPPQGSRGPPSNMSPPVRQNPYMYGHGKPQPASQSVYEYNHKYDDPF